MDDKDKGFGRTLDLDDPDQVARWCERLQCTELKLREAVRMVGPSYMLVAQWLSWQRLR